MEALRERFGKYHVLEKIAQGGMAEVYKVKTIGIAGFEKIQALKRILPHSAREGRFIRSFIDEARIAVELTHRNIVQVFDFGKADGELFLAMELIEGRDLRTAMAQATSRDLTCPIPVAAYVIAEAAAGLDYAHRKTDLYGGALGIVHCDVSPSNVMLSADGYVKILDFGIARATFASALERRRLRGKPRYMAPEQTLGEPPTSAADVFALGIIAWELFTGLPLYRGPDLKSILEAVRRTEPPRIDRLKPEVPKEIADAIAIALSREPAARGTAADLLAACARASMQGGARALAEWLTELDARSKGEVALSRDASSMSVQRSKSASQQPAQRPSQTQSLVPVPPLDLGAGTPGFSTEAPVPPPAPEPTATAPRQFGGGFEGDATTTSAQDQYASRLSTTGVSFQRFGDRDPTSGGTSPARFPDPTQTSQRRFGDRDPTANTATSVKWGHEGTASGVGRLADMLPPDSTGSAPIGPPAPENPRASRPSYGEIVLLPGSSPAALRFDDDVTAASFGQPMPIGDATSFDDLQVESDIAPPEIVMDEPIDDDLGALATGAPMERRRIVVVVGVLDDAQPETLRPIARSLGELAYQRGGVVLALEPDALVVAFGLEVAGEDDVAVAMGWALDATALTREREMTPVDIGAGVPTGPTLRIGARAGVASSTNPDGTARIPPDAIEEARGLAHEASPERPLFVGAAGRVTSNLYTLREVPSARRIARRGRVIEVVGPRGFEERDRARLQRRGKLVGRTAQLAELESWFQRAIDADRRLTILIRGAAGTGKSRLVAELIARRKAAGAPMRVVMTAANPASRHSPFALVIDWYQVALAVAPSRGRAARAQVVQRLLHLMKNGGTPDERARAVASDLDLAMELRDGVSMGTVEVADLRPRMSAGLDAFRQAMVDRQRPLLTVIEDIHHSDGTSLEVLRHTLAVPTVSAPELMILTTRPEGPAPPAVDVVIEIGDLVGAELRTLITDRLGEAATPLNIAAVIARGGGNPLFIEELAQAVREAGQRGAFPEGNDVPATARDVVAARVDRLSARAKAALRIAAVMGGTVRARLVEELLGEVPADDKCDGSRSLSLSLGSGDDAEAGLLDELVDAGFLVRPESSAHSNEGELYFARGLVREVIYEALPARAQRETHARIGRLLASRFFAGREEPPAVIADHLERGGELAAAAAFWLRAARLAMTASDADAGIAHFTRTLAIERELGAAPPTATSKTRRREALAGREQAHRLQGDLVSDLGDLDELQRLCEGDRRRLADVAIRRAHRMLRIGDHAGASVATVVAEDHAAAAIDGRFMGEALRLRGEILERLGRFDEALAVVEHARQVFAREGAVAEEMQAMVGRGRIYLMRAHYEAARAVYKPVIARIEATKDAWLERVVQNHVAIIEMCLGNYTVAMASAQRSLELCRRYGDRVREGDALSVSGIILLEVGMFDQAAATFEEALALHERTGSRWSRADCLIYAGACNVRRGKEGLAMLDEALAEATTIGARYLEANAAISRAGVHLRRGANAAAIADAAQRRCGRAQCDARRLRDPGPGASRPRARPPGLGRVPRRGRWLRASRARAVRSATVHRRLGRRGLRQLRRGPARGRRARSRVAREAAGQGRGPAQARRAHRSRMVRRVRRPARVQGAAP